MSGYRLLQNRFVGLLFFALLASASVAVQASEDGQNQQDDQKMLELWTQGDSGQRMRIRGRVTNADGNPIPNVRIRFRHADSEGIDRSYHQGELVTNDRGVYQFGSVIPGNSHRRSHVHVYISHPGFRYLETEFYFKDDPKANPDDPNAIFLEESNSDGETMMYGRWDVALTPE